MKYRLDVQKKFDKELNQTIKTKAGKVTPGPSYLIKEMANNSLPDLFNKELRDDKNRYYVDKFLIENILKLQKNELTEKTYSESVKDFFNKNNSIKETEMPKFADFKNFCESKLSNQKTYSPS